MAEGKTAGQPQVGGQQQTALQTKTWRGQHQVSNLSGPLLNPDKFHNISYAIYVCSRKVKVSCFCKVGMSHSPGLNDAWQNAVGFIAMSTWTNDARLHRTAGLSVELIAERLGRHRSTIFREIRRNTVADAEFVDLNGYYCVTAHDMACERRTKLRKLMRISHVRQSVIERIKQRWLPQ